MFSGCTSLKYLPDISKWDTNNIQFMDDLFSNCLSLKSLPDISKWNIKNVTNMRRLFYNCKSLKILPNISKWNLKNITDIDYIFYGCSSLLSLPNISKWNTKNLNLDNFFESSSLSISFKTSDIISSFQSDIGEKDYEKYGLSSLKYNNFFNDMEYNIFLDDIQTKNEELAEYYDNFFN